MMLATTLFTALAAPAAAGGAFAPVAAGAAAGAGAAATTAGAATASSSVLSVLQGIGTAFAALSTIGAGVAQSNQLKAQAQEEKFKSRDEYVAGVEQSARLKRELARTLQAQSVQFAAGGAQLGSVSAGEARGQVVADAERELGFASNDALRASLARRRRSTNLRGAASAAIRTSLFEAGGQLAQFGAGLAERG